MPVKSVEASGTRLEPVWNPSPLALFDGAGAGHLLRDALQTDIDHARTVNELVDDGADDTRHDVVEIVTVLPEEPVSAIGDLLDFEPVVARRHVEVGHRVAAEALEERGWGA